MGDGVDVRGEGEWEKVMQDGMSKDHSVSIHSETRERFEGDTL